jgi:hypothetical protein
MKRLGFANKFILSIVAFLLIANLSAAAPSTKTSWFWEAEHRIFKQVAEHLSAQSLNPILSKEDADFICTGFEGSSNEKVAFPLGQLKQGKETYELMFATVKKPNGNIEVGLVCLAKPLNNLPTPQLFIDVLAMASVFKREISEMKPRYVLIEPSNDSRLIQKWTFFNPKDKITLFVTLKPDGRGGTYFTVRDR